MRKKYLLIILPAMLVTLCLLAGAGYAIHKALAGVLPGNSAPAQSGKLTLNQKYYYQPEETLSEEWKRDYFVFYKNGTGDFRVYYKDTDKTYAYTIHFRYSVSSDTVTCTYKAVYFVNTVHTADRVTAGGGGNISSPQKYGNWSEKLRITGDALRTVPANGRTPATYVFTYTPY